MADVRYLELLYNELTQKLKTIHLYIDAIDDQVGSVYENVVKGVDICKKKYVSVQDYMKSTPKVTPDTGFAMEQAPRPIQGGEGVSGEELQDSVENLEGDLKAVFTEINFRFTKQQKNLAMLTAAHIEMQAAINNIFDQWKILNGEE